MKTRKNFPRLIASLYLMLLAGFVDPVVAANTARIFTLSADEWARPRSGAVIPRLAAVRAAVDYWDKGVDALVLIHHPGEDSGVLWASELRDWLISLGVPSDYIRLTAGTQEADQIKLVVGSREELEQ